MANPALRQLEKHIHRSAADSANVLWTVHAKSQMRARKVSLPLAVEVLRLGLIRIQPEDGRGGGLVCRLERFVAGVQVAVVVHVDYPDPDLTVITVIDVNGD